MTDAERKANEAAKREAHIWCNVQNSYHQAEMAMKKIAVSKILVHAREPLLLELQRASAILDTVRGAIRQLYKEYGET